MTTRMMLRAKLHGLVSEKKTLTRRRVQFKKKTRQEAEAEKRICALARLDSRRSLVRDDIRHHHLALGMLRGMPYRRMEPRCHEGNEPEPERIRNVLMRFLPFSEARGWTHDQIEAWLGADDGVTREAAE